MKEFPEKKEEQLTRKIEGKSLDVLFANENYDDYPDYPESWDDEPEITDETHFEKYGLARPTYPQFKAGEELKKIRKLSPKEIKLPLAERKELIKSRLKDFKEQLLFQKKGLGEVIHDVRKDIEANPDAKPEQLFKKIEKLAPVHRFSISQLFLLKTALEEYGKKHTAVEKYRNLYPNDADLFEACFASRPRGKVEVVKGPMTLSFLCHDPEDYLTAFSFTKNEKKEEDIEKYKVIASRCAGVARSEINIKELEGTVTVESVPLHLKMRRFEYDQKKEIHNKDLNLRLGQVSDIDIRNYKEQWKILFWGYNRIDPPDRIQLIDMQDPKFRNVFELKRIAPKYWTPEDTLGLLEPVGDESASPVEKFSQTLRSEKGGEIIIEIDYSFLKIKDRTPDGSVIRYKTIEYQKELDQEALKATITHEEQHQFNRLFRAPELKQDMWAMIEKIAEISGSPEEAEIRLVHAMVHMERVILDIDTQARDEILAQYAGGDRTVSQIQRIMAEADVYDYAKRHKEEIDKIPETVKWDLAKYTSDVLYDNSGNIVWADALEISEDEVKPHLDLVFGREYKRDLARWIDSLSVLENKGYSKDEIVSLLYQEPVNNWPRLAQRMTPKKHD